MMKIFHYMIVATLMLAWCACEKQEAGMDDAFDSNNAISKVVADNFNLSIYNGLIRRSQLLEPLNQAGRYTALAPSDEAFRNAGYGQLADIYTARINDMVRLANYHVLNGLYDLNEFPFLFNQRVRSRGGDLFVTHWIKGPDTVLTVNGARVVARNVPASNGYIQVLNRVLEPYVHDRLGDAVRGENDLTLFALAVERAGLLETIHGEGPYTVFAPSNAAMAAHGLQTVQQINEADPGELRELVRYHIVEDQRFINDYILSTGESNVSRQAMLDGNTIEVTLVADVNVPGGFSGVRLQGTGNTAPVGVVRQDILTGNGVLHIIDGVLQINQ